PVIIGVGQMVQHAAGLDDAVEPAELMARAVRAAADDAGLDGVPAPDSVRIVQQLSWRYGDPGRALADRLGLEPGETVYPTPGGNTPQSLINETAAEVQAGALDLAVLSGAECWRTRIKARKAGVALPWTKQPDGTAPDRVIGGEFVMNHPTEVERGIVMP